MARSITPERQELRAEAICKAALIAKTQVNKEPM